MSRLRTHLLAVAALVVAAGAVAPSHAAAYDVVGTPKLYAVDDPSGPGGPVAYVVFRGTSRLHEVRDARARVHGESGRSYSWPGACVRSSFIKSDPDGSGDPIPFLKAGRRYRVTISYRGTTVWSGTLSAHRLADRQRPPRC